MLDAVVGVAAPADDNRGAVGRELDVAKGEHVALERCALDARVHRGHRAFCRARVAKARFGSGASVLARVRGASFICQKRKRKNKKLQVKKVTQLNMTKKVIKNTSTKKC